MTALKKTVLHSLHISLSAKMVAFAGYHMPLHYADGIIKEHLHCRQKMGLFDISHMGQITIQSSSAAEEIETLTPGNIKDLQLGQQRYIILTNKTGGIIDDVIISRTDTGFLLVVNAVCKEKVFKHLQNNLSAQCKVEWLQKQVLMALQGPMASQLMRQLSSTAATLCFMQSCTTQIEHMPCRISRCGYTGEDGFEISIANQYAESLARKLLCFDFVKPIGLGARDTLRLEAGLGLYGNEFNESISPVEAELSWTFRPNAAHYLGAEIIREQQKTAISMRLVGIVSEQKSILRGKTILHDDNDAVIGFVSSGGYSPSLKRPIALAFIKTTYNKNKLIALVRKHKVIAQITRLPFVPHRYHR
jgi:aminomethyltransferase